MRLARDNLDRINWRLGRLEKKPGAKEGLAQNIEYQELRKEQERLTAEIARLEQQAPEEKEPLSTYTSNFIPLKTSLPEDPEIQKIVVQTKQEVNRSGQQNSRRGSAEPRPAAGMAGWNACRSCHPEQTAFWQGTRHAGAWQSLARAQQQFNQECLPCHVTLPTYDQETVQQQNLLSSLTPEFQDVGCEACHGPGEKHAANPGQERPLTLSAATCLACHSPEHDTDFSYEQKLRLIRCPPSAPSDKGAA